MATQTAEVMNSLRNMEGQQAFIRSNRDQLYRAQRAWQPILDGWADAESAEEVPWDLVTRSYQFLAPRYMPVTQWTAAGSPTRNARSAPEQLQAMSW